MTKEDMIKYDYVSCSVCKHIRDREGTADFRPIGDYAFACYEMPNRFNKGGAYISYAQYHDFQPTFEHDLCFDPVDWYKDKIEKEHTLFDDKELR